jgi:hypothetical protein
MLPKGMARHFEQAMTDPNFLDNKLQIALVTSRMADLLQMAADGEGASTQGWQEAQALCRAGNLSLMLARELEQAGKSAEAAGSRTEFERTFQALCALIQDSDQEALMISEALRLGETRRKLVDSEVKLLVQQGQMIQVAKVAVLIDALNQAIKDNVRDPFILEAIAVRFRRLLGRSVVEPLGAGSGSPSGGQGEGGSGPTEIIVS